MGEEKKMLPPPTARTPATKQAKALPKTGALCPQWVKCGKSTCHCAVGNLHGPYWYLFWRQGGRLRKRYIKPAEVEAVRAACDAERQRRRRWRRVKKAAQQQYRELLPLLREIERDGRR